ncbi:MAG: hypothetical protein AAF567_24325 [Actinomycetota bacterium]
MNGQLTLDDALARVGHNAAPDWRSLAQRIVAELAAAGEFIADDVWEQLSEHDDILTHEPRALGEIITTAQRSGLIVHTGRYARSRRRRAQIPVWTGAPVQTDTAMTG